MVQVTHRHGAPAAPASQKTASPKTASPTGRSNDPRARPALGITGFAVLVVVATNLGLPLPGSYLAIDILLVSIGFDVARTMTKPAPDNHWLKHFWLGRLGQLAAPLLLAVGLVALYWDWQGGLDEMKLRSVLGAVTMTLNYFLISGQAEFMVIDHLWLISLVAQFCVVVPLLVVAGPRSMDPERRVAAILGLAGGVALCRLGFLMAEAAGHQSIAINTLTRADGLLVGLALGIAPRSALRRRVPAPFAAPAFVALLFLLAIAPDVEEFPQLGLGMLTALTIALTATVVGGQALTAGSSAGRQNALSRTVDNQLMRWLGARAFSFYIWHHVFGITLELDAFGPVESLQLWPGTAVFIMRLVFGLAAAATSYRYLELPAMAVAARIAERPSKVPDPVISLGPGATKSL